MIVSRRYIPFCDLVRIDEYSREVIKKAYSDIAMSNEDKDGIGITCARITSVYIALIWGAVFLD